MSEDLHYRAYGLVVSAPLELPELPQVPATVSADIAVGWGDVTQRPERFDEHGMGFWTDGRHACHAVNGVGAFLVEGGERVTIDRESGVESRLLRLSLLGPALGIALLQRGHLVLHGSAVDIDGHAVAFLGAHGHGKSTTAAALAARGHRLLTDDVLPLDLTADRVLARPSYPQIKLWPDAVEALDHESAELPLLHPEYDKRALRPFDEFQDEPLPLDCIYILSGGESVAVEELPPQRRFQALMAHWYGARFGAAILPALDAAAHLRGCAEVARRVDMQLLRRPRDLAGLPDIVRTVERRAVERGGRPPGDDAELLARDSLSGDSSSS